MTQLKVGDKAPDFSLLNQHGEAITLKHYLGKNVIVYFYPKAATPGCTTQACGMRDSATDLNHLDAVVLGISPDAPSKLIKFDQKYELGFPLLADVNHEVAEAYGVWALKKFMGKEYMGIIRTTFIIDKNGIIGNIIEKVDVKTHSSDIIGYIKA